jgi:hypothetical protein
MVRLTILQRARLAGLSVRAQGDRLLVRGPRRLEALARELIDRKGEVMAALAEEKQTAWEDAVPLELGDFKIRTLDDLLSSETDQPRRRCYACRNARWWRLKRGGPWTCGRCHPPMVGEAGVVWTEGGAP